MPEPVLLDAAVREVFGASAGRPVLTLLAHNPGNGVTAGVSRRP